MRWWAERYDLLLHVSNRADIRGNVRAFAAVFKRLYPHAHVRYAGKATAHPAVFKAVADEAPGSTSRRPRAALDARVGASLLGLARIKINLGRR